MYLEDPVGRMKEEEGKEVNRGWLMAVSGGSKQLPIRRVEQEMKEEDLRGWTCKGAEGVSFFRFYRKERVAPSP